MKLKKYIVHINYQLSQIKLKEIKSYIYLIFYNIYISLNKPDIESKKVYIKEYNLAVCKTNIRHTVKIEYYNKFNILKITHYLDHLVNKKIMIVKYNDGNVFGTSRNMTLYAAITKIIRGLDKDIDNIVYRSKRKNKLNKILKKI
jgi:ribosome-associated translation inhibitor RaiA